jgi:hypothetical protein
MASFKVCMYSHMPYKRTPWPESARELYQHTHSIKERTSHHRGIHNVLVHQKHSIRPTHRKIRKIETKAISQPAPLDRQPTFKDNGI